MTVHCKFDCKFFKIKVGWKARNRKRVPQKKMRQNILQILHNDFKVVSSSYKMYILVLRQGSIFNSPVLIIIQTLFDYITMRSLNQSKTWRSFTVLWMNGNLHRRLNVEFDLFFFLLKFSVLNLQVLLREELWWFPKHRLDVALSWKYGVPSEDRGRISVV